MTVDVELHGISKRFDGVEALRDVTLTVRGGTIHGLVGENGAGKSTLGKIIAGVHAPDSGQLVIDGRARRYRSPRQALAEDIALIAQELALAPHRRAIDNAFLGAEPRRWGLFVRDREMRRRYDEIVDRAGFGVPAATRVGALRVADQQKVEILRALARNASVLVVDEPTATLAADEAVRLLNILRRLRTQGVTIIYVSHFLEEVLDLADEVTVMRDGAVVRTSDARMETPASLVTGMIGRELDLAFPPRKSLRADAPVVLRARGLSRTAAFADVDIQLHEGEIVGVAGLVGAGRTEVARAIFGVDRLDSGTVELSGEVVTLRHPRDARRAGMALIPENRKDEGLMLNRSVRSNLTLAHLDVVSYGGFVRRREEQRCSDELCQQLAVRAVGGSSPIASLSGGNQQKVLFARWMLRPPRVLIADEPTRGVDVGAKRSIYALIQRLASEGMAVLFISSELEEVIGLSHRVLVMRRGRMVAEFDSSNATETAVMRAAFATDNNVEEAIGR